MNTEFHGTITMLTKQLMKVSQNEIKRLKQKDTLEVHLFASLIKKDNFEWVLQKATELGVSRITPVLSERTVKLKMNMDRADKIVLEAAEQSGRADTVFLDEPITIKEALSFCETPVMALHTKEGSEPFNKFVETIDKTVSVFVGPEGGWGVKDEQIFIAKKVPFVTMGNQILRAETASVAVASLLLLGKE
jgi:16S rRNA (uracil1498-N3)-methyltransferase